MISIVVPAHNEEAVIARSLRAMTHGAQPGELEIVVACNGCSDRTAEIARAIGPPVRVVEIAEASKIAALNAADETARGYPRLYVDADVILDVDSIRRLAATLERGDALLAYPELQMDFRAASWAVRAFYRVWTALPYNNTAGMVGTGVYALSQAGRQRFDRFPDVIADDGFVRFAFAAHERMTVRGAVSHVAPPRTLGGLLRIKTRSRLGQFQLRQRYPGRATADAGPRGGLAAFVARHPELWLDVPAYVLVNMMARWRAKRRLRAAQLAWERDDSREALSSSR